MKRLLVVVCAAIITICSASKATCQPRPLRADDVVRLESFGRASASPDGRWAVFEKRGAYEAAPRFDRGPRSIWAIMDLWLVDVGDEAAPPVRLLPEEGPGLLRGGWSPSGARLLVYRYRDDRLEAGVVSFPERTVWWTGLTPDLPVMGSNFEWVSDDRLILMVRPDASLPWLLSYYGDGQRHVAERWTSAAVGQRPSRTRIDAQDGVVSTTEVGSDQALVSLNLRSATSQVLKTGRLVDFTVSPNARFVAITEEEEAVAVRPDVIGQAEPPFRIRLSLMDLVSGSVGPPQKTLDIAPHLLRWSEDSGALLIWARGDGEAWSAGNLLSVDPDGRHTIIPRPGLTPLAPAGDITSLQGVRADWMGRTPVLYARAEGVRFDWYALPEGRPPVALTERRAVAPSRLAAVSHDRILGFADGALWQFGLQGARQVSPEGVQVSEIVVSDSERPFRLAVNAPPRSDWSVVGTANGRTFVVGHDGSRRWLQSPPGQGDERTFATWGSGALVVEADDLREGLWLTTEAGARELDVVNAALADVVLPIATPIDHLDLAGRATRSWLFLSHHTPPGGHKGLVVLVYPGSTDSGAWTGPMTLTYGLRAQVLAGEGYAVLSASLPRDQAVSPEALTEAVHGAVNAALAAYPGLPRDRMAVVGHSFGAQAALWIASRSDRFRSYVAWAATTDMFGQWGEFTPASRSSPQDGFMFRNQQGWAEVGQGQLGAPPWKAPERYAAASPYLAADRISAPVLLITADRDFVTMSQSERMFSALYRLGGRTRLVTYWGEEHMLWSPANIRDFYKQISDWLSETLGDQHPSVMASPAAPSNREASLQTPPPG